MKSNPVPPPPAGLSAQMDWVERTFPVGTVMVLEYRDIFWALTRNEMDAEIAAARRGHRYVLPLANQSMLLPRGTRARVIERYHNPGARSPGVAALFAEVIEPTHLDPSAEETREAVERWREWRDVSGAGSVPPTEPMLVGLMVPGDFVRAPSPGPGRSRQAAVWWPTTDTWGAGPAPLKRWQLPRSQRSWLKPNRGAGRKVDRVFDEVFDVVARRFPDFGEAELYEDEEAGADNGAGSERQFAYCEDGDPMVIAFAPKAEDLPLNHLRGLMRHEFGHALEYRFGVAELERRLGKKLPPEVERRADAIAETVWGEPIVYDEKLIQCIRRNGTRPRPVHLPDEKAKLRANPSLPTSSVGKSKPVTYREVVSHLNRTDPHGIGGRAAQLPYGAEELEWSLEQWPVSKFPVVAPISRRDVRRYAEVMRKGSSPPAVVVAEGSPKHDALTGERLGRGDYGVWDGAHRVAAAREAGLPVLDVYVGRHRLSDGESGRKPTENPPRYLGQCDRVRRQSPENEARWQQMMERKQPVGYMDTIRRTYVQKRKTDMGITPNGREPLILYTGTEVWESRPEIRPARRGRMEHGPGLYFTTSRETAAKYGKGSRTVLRVEVDPDFTWLEDVTVPMDTLVDWVREQPGLKRKRELIRDLEERAGRGLPEGMARASTLVNLMHYYEAMGGKQGPALAEFLVSLGAGASHVSQSGDEEWVVLFDPSLVRGWRRVEADDPWMLPSVRGSR